MTPFYRPYDFLLACHCTYSSIFYHFWVDVEWYHDLEIWIRGRSR